MSVMSAAGTADNKIPKATLVPGRRLAQQACAIEGEVPKRQDRPARTPGGRYALTRGASIMQKEALAAGAAFPWGRGIGAGLRP